MSTFNNPTHEALFTIMRGFAQLWAHHNGVEYKEIIEERRAVPQCAHCQKEIDLCMCDDCKKEVLGES